jgi:urease accessory protein
MNKKFWASLAAAIVTGAEPAMAHPGHDAAQGLVHGLMHPVSGMDHVLTMMAVGLLAAHMKGRALWAVPLSFVAMMAVGGLLGMVGVLLPAVEAGIALSVIILGAAIALNFRPPTLAAMGLVGLFAVFHGYAHGAEMPADASGLTYAAGFLSATALLHVTGLALGTWLQRDIGSHTARIGGAAIAAAGAGLLAGWI